MIVHRGVHEVIALAAAADGFTAAMGAPFAARWDLPELLDVDVDQVTGRGMLVAAVGGPGADRSSGDQVALSKQPHTDGQASP